MQYIDNKCRSHFVKTILFHLYIYVSIDEFKFRNIAEAEMCQYISKFPDKSNSDILCFDVKLLKLTAHIT